MHCYTKNIVRLILVVAVLFLCTGCNFTVKKDLQDTQKVVLDIPEDAFGLELLYQAQVNSTTPSIRYEYYREKTTDIIYFRWNSISAYGDMDVMLNPETGLPLTYSEFKNMYNNQLESK